MKTFDIGLMRVVTVTQHAVVKVQAKDADEAGDLAMESDPEWKTIKVHGGSGYEIENCEEVPSE
ncbi:hypothetical protein [Roseomonas sp. WA12]